MRFFQFFAKFRTSLCQRSRNIEVRSLNRQDPVDPGTHKLLSKIRQVYRLAFTLIHKLLVVAIPESLCRASLGTPGLEPLAGTIIAQVAFLHQPRLRIKFWYAKGTGIDTIAAAYTARWLGHLHHAIGRNLNRHDRADL